MTHRFSLIALLGAVAIFLAVVSWFTILFAGTHIAGIRQFASFYLRGLSLLGLDVPALYP